MPYDEFEWRTMTKTINKIPVAPSLLRKLIFKNEHTNSAVNIDVDLRIGGRKILPYVSNESAAIVLDKISTETRTVKTPRIRVKKEWQAYDLLQNRGAGQTIYLDGPQGIVARRREELGRELQDIKNRADFTIEMACAEALSGSISNTYGHGWTVDFLQPAANRPVLGAGVAWNDGGDVFGDIQVTFPEIIRNGCFLNPTVAIMAPDVAAELRLNHSDIFDNTVDIARGSLKYDANDPFLGYIAGIPHYVYADVYEDEDGATQPYIPAGTYIQVAQAARFSVEYGAIADHKAIGAGKLQSKFFSKTFEIDDPSGLWLLAETRPIPVPWQPDAIVYASVLV